MEMGKVVKWTAKIGDTVGAGDVYAEIETDKATVAFEAQDDGILAAILVPEGSEEIVVGQPIGILVEDAADVAAFKDFVLGSAPPAAAAPVTEAPAAPAEPEGRTPLITFTHGKRDAPAAGVTTSAPAGRIFASPLARTLAAEAGYPLGKVKGTGPKGRIVADDVRKAIAAGPPVEAEPAKAAKPAAAAPKSAPAAVATPPPAPGAVPYVGVFPIPPRVPEEGRTETIPVTAMRRVIAQRLSESKMSIPHYYVTVECDLENLVKTRTFLNKALEKKGTKISVNDFVIKAASYALGEVPEVNSMWQGSTIVKNSFHDISVAADVGSGLITPIVRDVQNKGLAQISGDVKGLVKKAKENKLLPTDFQGGTFTISNMGMMGVKNFTAVINPPQSCILAVSAAQKVLKPADNAQGFRTATIMDVTLSSDHRVVDGAVAARWCNAFKDCIENPNLLIA